MLVVVVIMMMTVAVTVISMLLLQTPVHARINAFAAASTCFRSEILLNKLRTGSSLLLL